MTDHELIERIRTADDMDAFDMLFRRYYPGAIAMAKAMLHDGEAARDTVQDLFLRLWTGRANLDPDKSVRGLIMTSTRNAALNVIRNRHDIIMSAISNLDEPMSDETSQAIRLSDTKALVSKAVDAMPPVRRRVYRMSREEGKDAESIANELGISPRTVSKHIELALKDIRKQLS